MRITTFVCRASLATLVAVLPGCLFIEFDVGDEVPDAEVYPDAPFPDAEPLPAPDASVAECTLVCPEPASTTVMNVCGSVLDLASSQTVGDPAALEANLYDALSFLSSSPDNRPLPIATVPIDPCGRYAALGIKPPATGYVAVAIDDAAGTGADTAILTGIAIPATANTRPTANAWVARKPSAFGAFADGGAFVAIFEDTSKGPAGPLAGLPVAGVTCTASGSPVAAENVTGFDDAAQLSRVAPNMALDTTGPNGTCIVTNAPLVQYGGSGPNGCTWTSGLGATVAGALFVQERTGTCP